MIKTGHMGSFEEPSVQVPFNSIWQGLGAIYVWTEKIDLLTY